MRHVGEASDCFASAALVSDVPDAFSKESDRDF
jgi:hypothetical protein